MGVKDRGHCYRHQWRWALKDAQEFVDWTRVLGVNRKKRGRREEPESFGSTHTRVRGTQGAPGQGAPGPASAPPGAADSNHHVGPAPQLDEQACVLNICLR